MNKRINLLIKAFSVFIGAIFFCVITSTWAFAARTEPLIIDHTCRDVSQIPEEWIDAVKAMTLHHTGQSHGTQVPHGMVNLENEDATFDQTQNEGGIPAGSGLKITRGQRSEYSSWTSGVGVERYWQGESGKDWTRRTLDYHAGNGDTVHASLHTWCWDLRTWSEAQVNDYLASMETLEAEYPDVTFVYMTDTCDSTGSTGYNRWQRNQQIRAYCQANNKVLFDFADLESWSSDGTTQSTYSYSGYDVPTWHSDWTSDPYYNDGHINEAACTMKAKAMWWLLARLAGWNADGAPVANFSGTPTTGTAPLEVSFTDSSTGEIDSWSWSFGDGGTSTDQNPTYTYDDPGPYTVILQITGPGGSDTKTKNDYITVTVAPQPPVANFSGTPTSGTAPLEVSFTDSSTGEIEIRSWTFGDGGSSTEQNPAYIYDDPGTYTVTLEVTGPGGSYTRTRTNYITVNAVPTEYTLTVNPDGEGSVTLEPPGGTYDGGTLVQLTAVPGGSEETEGVFTGWSGDLSGSDNPATITMDSDKTVAATFIEIGVENGDLTSMSCVDPGSIEDSEGKPDDFPYGLIEMEIEVINAGDQAIITIYLPKVAPADCKWYKYTSTGEWIDFDRNVISNGSGDGAVFNVDRTEITLYIIDNGQYDDDPAVMILRDPSGLGFLTASGGAGSSSSGGGGCFIGTGKKGEP